MLIDCESGMITNTEVYSTMRGRNVKHASYEDQLRFKSSMERGVTVAFLVWLNLLSIFTLLVCIQRYPHERFVIFTSAANLVTVLLMDAVMILEELLTRCYPGTTATKKEADNDLTCPLLP